METACDDNYFTFSEKAAECCNLQGLGTATKLSFKMNGARIVDRPVSVKGKKKPWTMGSYLLMMKSPSAVKIGVGYISEPSSNSSDDSVCSFIATV